MFGQSKSSTPQNRIDSLIGADTRLDGDLTFSGGLRVDGEVHGSIRSDEAQPGTLVLVVSEQARSRAASRCHTRRSTAPSSAQSWPETRWNSSPMRVSQVTLNTVKSKFSWELLSTAVSCTRQTPRRRTLNWLQVADFAVSSLGYPLQENYP